MITKIKIISCSDPNFWYKDRIGEILNASKVIGYYGTYVYEYYGENNGTHINGILKNEDIVEV